MNDVPLYHRYTEISRRDTLQALQDFAHAINWCPDGSDAVLDAGCGPGDITHNIIAPYLPPNFSRLVGVDISDKMIDYARKTYTHPKLSFHQFNLDVPLEKQSLAGVEPFDHIFSSYCLMWISKPKQCLANFYELLKPGGDMLLWFLPCSPTRDVYRDQSKNSRFANYMTDIDQFVSPYHHWTDPAAEFRKLLVEAGFTNATVEVHEKGFNRSYAAMQDALQAVNPFVDRIPDEEKQAYLDDFMQRIAKKCTVYGNIEKNKDGCRLTFHYKLLIAYARK